MSGSASGSCVACEDSRVFRFAVRGFHVMRDPFRPQDEYSSREFSELQRRAFIYGALIDDPGPRSLEELHEWYRLVVGSEGAIGDRLTNRLQRIAAHIENGGAR